MAAPLSDPPALSLVWAGLSVSLLSIVSNSGNGSHCGLPLSLLSGQSKRSLPFPGESRTHPVLWQEDRARSHGNDLYTEKLYLESHVSGAASSFSNSTNHLLRILQSRPLATQHRDQPVWTFHVHVPSVSSHIPESTLAPPKWSLRSNHSQSCFFFATTNGFISLTYGVRNSQGLHSCLHLCWLTENIPEGSCRKLLSPNHQHSAVWLPTGLGDLTCGLGVRVPWVTEGLNSYTKLGGHRTVASKLCSRCSLRAQETLVAAGPSCH